MLEILQRLKIIIQIIGLGERMYFRSLFLFLFLIPTFFLPAIEKTLDTRSHSVVVSISPYKYFVDAIAGNTVKVHLLVPSGTSFHDYEPTPKQMANAANSDIWFRIGETFETHAVASLKGHNPRMRVVDLRDGIDLITLSSEGACPHCIHSGADLHIWLSPKQTKTQVKAIAKALIDTYPEHTTQYQMRRDEILSDLDSIDREIADTLRPVRNRTIMVAHPAYAYFTRDYGLQQLPIEYEGKDPSPRQLDRILREAHQKQVKTIFVQKEYGSKGAYLIADQLGAKIETLAPYTGDDYFNSLRNIANKIAEQDK